VAGDAAAALAAGRVEEEVRVPPLSTSAGLLGKLIGRKNGPHCLSVPKQRSGVLLVTPRGSKPTRSNLARTSSV